MRILVYGAGVQGANLASSLYSSGKDVTLLARGSWAGVIRSRGLQIREYYTRRRRVSYIPVIETLLPDDFYDVIFIALRYTQLGSIIDVLKSNRSKNIVFIGNNAKPEYYASLLPEKNVMFAFSSAAGRREGDMVISMSMRKIVIGDLMGNKVNEDFIRSIFDGTRYNLEYEEHMEDYLLSHAAYVLPIVFGCYKTGGNLGKLRHDRPYLNRIIDANIEGYRAIVKAGYEIRPSSDSNYESQGYRKLCYRFLRLLCIFKGLGRICVSDHAMNAVDEMKALNDDIKDFFDQCGAEYNNWKMLESDAEGYLDE